MPREQIVGLELPATPAEKALEWVPGYLAAHTTYQAARGYRVENSEIVFALFDGVSTATFFGKLVGQAIKTVGRQMPRRSPSINLGSAERSPSSAAKSAGLARRRRRS